jgi:hypothetical protein
MTDWGFALLALYVGLGLTTRLSWRKASRLAVIVSALVLVAVFASYGALR